MLPSRPWLRASLWLVALLECSILGAAQVPDPMSFGIQDYLELRRFTDLALSPSGEWIAYAISRPVLEENSSKREVFIQNLNSTIPTHALPEIADARQLQWIPRTRQLAFISARSGIAQVYSIDAINSSLHQWTHATDPVQAYRFSASARLAYTTRRVATAPSLVDSLNRGAAGIVIDPSEVFFQDFLPTSEGHALPEPAQLWVQDRGGVRRTEIPGDVGAFSWSTDGKLLSVTFIHGETSAGLARNQFSSVGVLEIARHRFNILFAARGDAPAGESPTGYLGGEWVPGQHRILIRRVSVNQIWLREHFPDWAFARSDGKGLGSLHWHATDHYHGRYLPVSDDQFLTEDVKNGIGSLYRVNDRGSTAVEPAAELGGYSSLFSVSTSLSTIAFVNEGLTRPPEIYVWDKRGGHARQLTQLNISLSSRQMPRARAVHWSASDGTTVSGYLLQPRGVDQAPTALVTMVHGGPCGVFSEEFAGYFPLWPFPLEVLPACNISVFIPNYRGTCSFGRHFQSPSDLVTQPVDDILTGIDYLVRAGVADPSRLGIVGHSHGGWLAPMVMARSKRFKVGSFAEGWTNLVELYELFGMDMNREVYDVIMPGSLYSSVTRYLEASPDLQLKGVSTAILTETGALSGNALLMLPLAKAAIRFGLPTEAVVYPHTDHNIESPRTQLEAANRNLDWIRYWLLEEQDPSPSKADQYLRWQKLRQRAQGSQTLESRSAQAAVGAELPPQ